MAPKRTVSSDEEEEAVEPTSPSPKKRRLEETPQNANVSIHKSPRQINQAGKPAECGIIKKIYVEQFMCHQKLTISLCDNVNFIHGQNGSGKSAILAALQICLGAGAKRTHRARNLKDLVRKEGGATTAKVRVTLLNKGPDAFQHDIYGDTITVERSIPLGGGFNGYKLLGHDMLEKSRKKADLNLLLDQLNIQVENPVAVLDQEEAKKFLTGKAEDKYEFFLKATDLERLDRKYSAAVDHINELDMAYHQMQRNITPMSNNVKELQHEWEEFQKLEKLVNNVAKTEVKYAWSLYTQKMNLLEEEQHKLSMFEEHVTKCKQKLDKVMQQNEDNEEKKILEQNLNDLTAEAQEATRHKGELTQEYKEACKPKKQLEQQIKHIKSQMKQAKNEFTAATRELQRKRDEILQREGSAHDEEMKRAARTKQIEEDIAEAKIAVEEGKKGAEEFLKKYEEGRTRQDVMQESENAIRRQCSGVQSKIGELKSNNESTLRMFGAYCEAMNQKVLQAQRAGKFRGRVVGPVGKFLKVAPGKDRYAAIAEKALQVGLDRFIVTNKQDRALYLRMRQEVGCKTRDCGVYQMSDGPRYNIRQPPEGIETVASVLMSSDYLVFNCLVDNGRIDQKALCESYDASLESLLVTDSQNRSSIRGGNIKTVFCLPRADFWQLYNGNLSTTSSDGRLNESIGVDRSQAIRQAESELRQLKNEESEQSRQLKSLRDEREHYKIQWNKYKKQGDTAKVKIQNLNDALEQVREEAEAAVNITFDTSELEDDVKKSEEAYEALKTKQEEMSKSLEDMLPDIEAILGRIEEVKARNNRVKQELNAADDKLSHFLRGEAERARNIEKREAKLKQAERGCKEQAAATAEAVKAKDTILEKSKILELRAKRAEENSEQSSLKKEDRPQDGNSEFTEEELNAVEPQLVRKEPDWYNHKISRMKKEIEREKQRRNLTESDPEVAFEKFKRAKKALDTKMAEMDRIEENKEKLITDVKNRKSKWKEFRRHIEFMTTEQFDEVLNRKGSSGAINFDHKEKSLGLVVQKDNKDEKTRTNDVKALSGGERSFTTLALLLALGESLETPFRVMDEFDVFLDPISRKIAMHTMIEVAKEFEHRQFIFITPQDLSSIKTDPKLKIFELKAPKRSALVGGAVQQTL